MQLLDPVARRENVTIELASCDAPVMAEVDRSQIQQVISNIIENAIHAMAQGGTVTVRVEPGPFRPTATANASDQPAARVSIEDQGIGITAENLDHIFDPFFTTKEVGKGTGLGLSIAYGIVQDHGGWIEVSSRPGEGSRFLIYLPLAETRCTDETSTGEGADDAARRPGSLESRPIGATSRQAAPSS